ncbi:hypothetical protein FHX36_001702 [Modestobacter versicolor]|uniref:Adhesin domain-containing protein n=1 Tax=Modestobacter versicolor TaxID=429133 RepID=A0A839Y0F3_9ACTN|nr:hypothetical protein [Modestobacter versicolor]
MSRTSRNRVLLFTVGLVGLLAGAGVVVAVSLGDRQTSQGGEVHEGVSAVDVRQDCGGDVTLVPAETATAVDVRWSDRWSASQPEHDAELTDGRLVVSVRCPGVQLVWGSTSALTVGVPAGVPVTVDSGAGDVRAEGTSGDLEVRNRCRGGRRPAGHRAADAEQRRRRRTGQRGARRAGRGRHRCRRRLGLGDRAGRRADRAHRRR